MTICKDGALYQQYKLEGKNFRPMELDIVFETAMAMEQHLLTSERRISQMIADTLVEAFKADLDAEEEASNRNSNTDEQ